MPTRAMAKGGIEGIICDDAVSGDVIGEDDERSSPANNFKEKGSMRNNGTCRRKICCSNESSSSLGKNSDLSNEKKSIDCEEDEVQSSYKGPLNSMDALEEALPLRRGISRFYNGKSKSFASLADASSIKDIAKPDNPYMRRRRNLLACNLALDKTRNNSALRGNNGGGISKRANNTTKTTLALAIAMNQASKDDKNGGFGSDFSSLRSFSMVDLQQHK